MKQKLLSFIFVLFCLVGQSIAQSRQVSGRVTSSTDGAALSGVSVSVAGTNTATQTDESGNYFINVASNGTLLFTYVGHMEQRISVGNRSTINVILQGGETAIEDVVVIGYGTGTNLSSVVGSVSRVTSKDISGRPTANALESLQGKVPGLSVFTSNGEPSATQSIRLHGVGSLGASSEPLYVVDGIPVDQGSIVSMNPEDFASVTVLKDASATSIYGARAANGVIYLTTKRGVAGERAAITLRSQLGWSNLATTKAQEKLMRSEELFSFWEETGVADADYIADIREKYPHDTQWYKYYLQENAPMQQHDLNISGGSDKTTYYLSAGFFDQEGLAYRSSFDRVNLRSNINTKLNDWINVGVNLAGSYDRRETNGWFGTNNLNGGLALLAEPFYSPYDENGNEYYDTQIPGLNMWSPKYLADKNPSNNKLKHFNPTAYIQVQPISGLTLKVQGGIDFRTFRGMSRRMPSYKSFPRAGTATENFDERIMRTLQNTAEYKFDVQEKHSFALLAGHEFVDFTRDFFSASSQGMTDDELILLPSGPRDRSVDQTKTQYAFNSFFGRVSYSFDKKYYFDVTVRQDESSRFTKENAKATFWSLGGMWNAKSESFLQDVNWLTDFRLRASIGTSGNSEIGNYNNKSLVTTGIYNSSTTWSLTGAGNPDLVWESQRKFSVGFNSTFLDRFHLDFEYYNRKTSDMLVDVPYPFTSGFVELTRNVGDMVNNGIDIGFSVDIFKNRDYTVKPYINMNYNKEKVTSLFDGHDYWVVPNTGVTWVVGQPVMFFYPTVAGVNPETGLQQWYVPGDDPMVTNKDPNNVTSTFSETALQQNTGLKRYPPVNGGFGLETSYKGFSIDGYFAFSQGKYLINNDRYFYENPAQFAGYNQSRDVLDYWKKPGDVAKFPKFGSTNQFDSNLIEDASFLRLKTLTVSYRIPKTVLNKTKFFSGARIFYTGRNLFTSTKYLGPDPEVNSNLTLGVNPNTKQSVFGLELQF